MGFIYDVTRWSVLKILTVGFGILLLSGCASYGVIHNKEQTGAASSHSYSIKADAGRRGTRGIDQGEAG